MLLLRHSMHEFSHTSTCNIIIYRQTEGTECTLIPLPALIPSWLKMLEICQASSAESIQ